MNKYEKWPKQEIFLEIFIPPETAFFVRLDGWNFKKLSEKIKTEKPFDERFAKCLVSSGKTLFDEGFSPALIYVVSDELNVLFIDAAPFRRRVEKINSVLASLISSAFTVNLKRFFNKENKIAFDSRIIIIPNEKKIIDYLGWRQTGAWRNHNNAYAYWFFRKMGLKPSEISRKLEGLKTKELHEILFKQGVNLAKTPQWQRRGILLHKQPFTRKIQNHPITRWKTQEKWNLPLFLSKEGIKLIKQVLNWTRQKRKS
ncbi:guanylyltransferase [Candidatus Bathyarchaeota archaeon]|nr:guanylyltransferase [Candidatus Bathyarchaeota archaeon]